MNKPLAHIYILIGIVISSITVLCYIIYHEGGVLDPEPLFFIHNYLDTRSLLSQILDTKNDWGYYQARELSYAFDALDAKFIRASTQRGLVHFYSVTHLFGTIIISALIALIGYRFLRVRSLALTALVIFLLTTSPPFFFSVSFFRSAKILATVFLLVMILLTLLFVTKKQEKGFGVGFLLIYVVVGFLLTVADRQGFFFVLSGLALFGLAYTTMRSKRVLLLLQMQLVILAASLTYTYVLGPPLIEMVTGTRPNLAYMKLDFFDYGRTFTTEGVQENSLKLLITFLKAQQYLIDALSDLLGGLSGVLALLIWPLALLTVSLQNNVSREVRKFSSGIVLIVPMLFVAMYTLMGIKHALIFLPVIRTISYYSIPFLAVSALLLLWMFSIILAKYPRLHIPITVLLFILAVNNVRHIPIYSEEFKHSQMNTSFQITEYSRKLKHCISNRHEPLSRFSLIPQEAATCQLLRN